MEFHIRNFAPLFVVCLCGSRCHSAPQGSEGFLVFQRGEKSASQKLEAIGVDGKSLLVLRENFSIDTEWNIARDGSKLCFSRSPADLRVFASAREVRQWLFSMSFDGKPQVLLNPFVSKGNNGPVYDFTSPTWNFEGASILVAQSESDDYSVVSWLALLDAQTKRILWDSRPVQKVIPKLPIRRLFNSKLSPDGRHIVCLAASTAYVGTDAEEGERDWSTYLLHFDLSKNRGEILARYDLGRYNPNYSMTSLDWNSDNVRFTFALNLSKKKTNQEIYVSNWKTKQTKRLTTHPAFDSEPVWISRNRIAWLSTRLDTKQTVKSIFVMNANGTNQKPLFKTPKDVSNLRYVEKLPAWSRYKNLDTTPLSKPNK